LEVVHESSTELEKYMPHKDEHTSTVTLLKELKEAGSSLFLFSNAPDFHVWRVLDHIG